MSLIANDEYVLRAGLDSMPVLSKATYLGSAFRIASKASLNW